MFQAKQRKAAQRKKMRNVDSAAALLAGGVMGGGIGNSRLTDKAAQALYDRSVKNAAMRQARKEGRLNPALGFPAIFRKDGSPKEGEIKFEYDIQSATEYLPNSRSYTGYLAEDPAEYRKPNRNMSKHRIFIGPDPQLDAGYKETACYPDKTQ